MQFSQFYLAGVKMATEQQPIIEVKNLKTFYAGEKVHDDLNLSITKGEILAIIGGSGSGKTTLMNSILKLTQPAAGQIFVSGLDILKASDVEIAKIRQRWGVLFQNGALFTSLTVLENVMFPLRIFSHLPHPLQQQIASLKIKMTGLPLESGIKYPAELSGGMIKRAGLARAIALDPEILFLDEPTSGLDPQSSNDLCDLVENLRDGLGITIVIITHDIELLLRITDRVAFLGNGKVLAVSPIKKLLENPDPLIQEYFSNVKEIRKN